jgi:hypothetical protein
VPQGIVVAECEGGVYAEVGGHRDEVILCELHRPCHQLDVRGPERLERVRQPSELGSPKRQAVVRERPVPEGLADTVVESAARLRE